MFRFLMAVAYVAVEVDDLSGEATGILHENAGKKWS